MKIMQSNLRDDGIIILVFRDRTDFHMIGFSIDTRQNYYTHSGKLGVTWKKEMFKEIFPKDNV